MIKVLKKSINFKKESLLKIKLLFKKNKKSLNKLENYLSNLKIGLQDMIQRIQQEQDCLKKCPCLNFEKGQIF